MENETVKPVLSDLIIDEHMTAVDAAIAAAPEMRKALERQRAAVDAKLAVLDRLEGKAIIPEETIRLQMKSSTSILAIEPQRDTWADWDGGLKPYYPDTLASPGASIPAIEGKRRGRPKGSKNLPKAAAAVLVVKRRGRPPGSGKRAQVGA